MVRVGLAHNWDHLHGRYFSRAVAPFPFGAGLVHLDELREVAAVTESIRNGILVGREAISSDLETSTGRSVPQTFNETVRRVLIAFSQGEIEDQFRVAFDGDIAVGVAEVRIILGSRVMFSRLPGSPLLFMLQSLLFQHRP
jgi:hypothetical protein